MTKSDNPNTTRDRLSTLSIIIITLISATSQAALADDAVRFVAEHGVDQGLCLDAAAPCASITYAVDVAEPGDTIDIAEGTYTEAGGVHVLKPLSFHGGGQDLTKVQAHEQPGQAGSRVFQIEGDFVAHLEGMTIRHGVAGGSGPEAAGGGLLATDVQLSLHDVAIRNNWSSTIGGGVALMDADGQFEDVLLESNSAETFGGGMLLGGSASKLQQVVFRDNHAGWDGGGLAGSVSTLELVDVTFDGNIADGWGGGMYAQFDTTGELAGVQFLDNDATWGGGLFLQETAGVFSIQGSLFQENFAGNGGGLYAAVSFEVADSQFIDNGSLHGGGMMIDGGDGSLNNVDFTGNVASGLAGFGGLGGGLYVTSNGSATLNNVLFQENLSAGGARMGGGMLVESASATLGDVAFIDNEARYGGGLLMNDASGTIEAVVFAGNQSEQQGGGMANLGSSPIISDVLFTNNHSGDAGGGMFNTNSGPMLSAVEFRDNTADSGGGGMANAGSATPMLLDVTFIDNVSLGTGLQDGGGALRNRDGSIPILNRVTFTGNASHRSGGAIHSQSASLVLEAVGFFDNEAMDGFGGGIFFTNGMGLTPGLIAGNVVLRENVADSAGGGLYLRDSEATLVNALLASNQSGRGGGINADESTIWLTSATLAGNIATQEFSSGAALRLQSDSAVTLLNSIIWGNQGGNGVGGEIHAHDSDVGFEYSLFSDHPDDIVVGGTGSLEVHQALNVDPQFMDVMLGNFRLLGASPAIDAGDPDTSPDQFPVDDQGVAIDLDGSTRFAGDRINMGAYESIVDNELLVAYPAHIDFGTVEVGASGDIATVGLTSAGLEAASVDSVNGPEPPFELVGGSCPSAPFVLQSGESCTLEFGFQPVASGDFEHLVTINDAGDVVAVTLVGSAALTDVPELEVSPEIVAVQVESGETASEDLSIANIGQGLLEWEIFTAEPPASGRLESGRVIDCESAPGLVIHDGGVVDLGFPSFVPDAMIVDHFEPSFYPAAIEAVCLSLVTLAADSIDFEVVILADDGPGGAPGTELGSLAFTATDLPEFGFPPPPDFEPIWYTYDLAPLELSVSSGGVYVGVRWVESEESAMIGIDGSSDNPPGYAGGYLWNPMAGEWAPIESELPPYRALLVRTAFGIEAPTSCQEPAEVEWLSASPASGSVPGGEVDTVSVAIDASQLSADDYEALLCVGSNDPLTPVVEVPVAVKVSEPKLPAIEVFPLSLSVELGTGDGEDRTLTINNSGEAGLFWQVDDSGACGLPDWASVVPVSGTVAGNDSQEVTVTFDASGLDPDDYTATLCIDSNDPAMATVEVELGLGVRGLAIFQDRFEADDNG